jgi:hypothetical protein
VLLVALAGVAWWWFHRPAPAYRAQDPGIYPFQAWSADGKPQKWGFIDAEGNVLIQPEWDDVDSTLVLGRLVFCSEGFCGVRKDGKWGFVDTSGLPVIPAQFDAVGPFIEGRARATMGNQVGYIDKTGQYAVSPQFDNAGDFHDGLAAVHTNGGWGFINKLGAFVVTSRFQAASIDGFSDGLAGVCMAGKCGYIDRNGAVAINFIFDAANTFSEGMASVQINGKWGFINTSGKTVINLKPQFDRTTMFSGGLAGIVYQGQTLGPVNMRGSFPLKGVYEARPVGFDLQVSEYDLWTARTSDGMGLLTRDGKWVVKPSRALTGVGAIFGKVFQGQVSGQWVPISISGKVLAGPYKGAMLDSLAQDIDNESSALESMHVLTAAEENYSRAYPARGFTSLDKLGPATGAPDEDHAGFLDAALATGTKDGYQFTITLPDSASNGRYLGCTIRARPLAGHAGREFTAVSYADSVSNGGIHYDVQGSPIDEFYPEANLDVTMQFILHKLNGIGTVSFIAYNNAGQRHLLKYEFSNISADQSQCLISYWAKFARDGSPLENLDYQLPLRDFQDALVEPYTQYENESTSTDPPLTVLLVRRSNGRPLFFPFADAAPVSRVARALTRAAGLCRGGI